MSQCHNRFVFVAGLHRTGTSLLARILGAHPAVGGIEGAPVPENEGCYLQGGIPHTACDGRPARYATDPHQHHTEQSRWNTLETQQRMLSDWSQWLDPAAPWWLEKSPVNLTRMRLYQQLFPTAQFIVILRHPEMMAAALAKWVDDGPDALIRYALDAYDVVEADLTYLHAALVIRYEDLVARPDVTRKALFAFLDLDDHEPGIELRDGNADYGTAHQTYGDLAQRLRKWGYAPGGEVTGFTPHCTHPLRKVQEATEHLLTSQVAEK